MAAASEAALSQYKVLVFDCYGTLIDWETGIHAALQPLLSHPNCPDVPKVFEALFANERNVQDETKDMLYPRVLEESYRRTCADLKLACEDSVAEAFGNSVGSWPAFPDSSLALSTLKDLGLRLVVLSNVDNASFARSRTQLEKGWTFDAVCTAEDIGSYKPDLRNFRYVLEVIKSKFGIEPQQVLSVAQSKFHDVQPAHEIGLKAVWINRPKALLGARSDNSIQPDWEFPSMETFAAAMERARSSQ